MPFSMVRQQINLSAKIFDAASDVPRNAAISVAQRLLHCPRGTWASPESIQQRPNLYVFTTNITRTTFLASRRSFGGAGHARIPESRPRHGRHRVHSHSRRGGPLDRPYLSSTLASDRSPHSSFGVRSKVTRFHPKFDLHCYELFINLLLFCPAKDRFHRLRGPLTESRGTKVHSIFVIGKRLRS